MSVTSMQSYHEFVIIGAGPGGLQAASCLAEKGCDYLVIEGAETPGAAFERFPRHRMLISINKVYTGYSDQEVNLRWDWNSLLSRDKPLLFRDYSQTYFPAAEDMVRYLAEYSRHHNLRVRQGVSVTGVSRTDRFELTLSDGSLLQARVLIVATGLHQPWLPDIPGIEHAETYCDMDTAPERLANKRVLILGKGNSGFETADALVSHAALIHVVSPNPLKMAWSTHYVGHLRAVNNNFLDTYQLKSQNALLDADISRIEYDGKMYRVTFGYQHAEGERETIEYDAVIACTGFRFDTALFDESCCPELCPRGKLPAQNSDWQSQNVPDMYFAGTLMQYRDYKRYMSGFIHGFRYNVRTLADLLAHRYAGADWPAEAAYVQRDAITDNIIERVNTTSALWQQPGFLADVLVMPHDGSPAVWRRELPVDYIEEHLATDDCDLLTLTLEFGARKFDNPFHVHRIARDNTCRAEDSNFLHPIVRSYRQGKRVSEHHVIEDLAAEWREPEHVEPLRGYVDEVLSRIDIPQRVSA